MAIEGHIIRPQLMERRMELEAVSCKLPDVNLTPLLAEVDAALNKIDIGTYGLCETCCDSIEKDRLELDPLCRFCLDHLSIAELAAHQGDLDLAMRIQVQLLPPRKISIDGWEAEYRYEPAGAVGGDYCELISMDGAESGCPSLFFALGDVSGKGIAASLLMTHLSAIFRTLLSMNLPLEDMVSRANRLFCESTGPAHYATLVCGRTTANGFEICNAGHCPPFIIRENNVDSLEPNGLPLGLFARGQYGVSQYTVRQGESLVLYSDGVTEATDPFGEDYQTDRLQHALSYKFNHKAEAIADTVLNDVKSFAETGMHRMTPLFWSCVAVTDRGDASKLFAGSQMR